MLAVAQAAVAASAVVPEVSVEPARDKAAAVDLPVWEVSAVVAVAAVVVVVAVAAAAVVVVAVAVAEEGGKRS